MANKRTEVAWMGVVCAALGAVLVPMLLHRIFFFKKVDHESSAGSYSLEEYMTKHGMSELDAKFQVAVDFITARRNNNMMTNEQKLTLYAFYKQAHFGTCSVNRPSGVDMVGSAKWESWKALGDMSQEVAKQQYFGWVQDLFEEFDVRGPKRWRSSSVSSPKTTIESVSLDNQMSTMAGAVSTPKVDTSTEEWKVNDDIFHYASTGDMDKLVPALNKEDIDAQDLEGRTMMHWAVDRDQQSIVKELLRRKASPNIQDADGMTPLHYAASCDHEEMAQLLVKHGALVDIEDLDGDTPLMMASSQALQLIIADGSTRDLQ